MLNPESNHTLLDESSFAWMDQCSHLFEGQRLPVTEGMKSAWESQTAPSFPPSLNNAEDVEKLYCWWLIDGIRHYPRVPFVCTREHILLLGQEYTTRDGRVLPLWAWRYWQSSYLLQTAFPLTDDDSLADFFIWLHCSPNLPQQLLQALPWPESCTSFLQNIDTSMPLPIPRGLKAVWAGNIAGAQTFDVRTSVGCAALLCWFLLYDTAIIPGVHIECEASLAPFLLQDDEDAIPLFAKAILLVRPDAENIFSFRTASDRSCLYSWFCYNVCSKLHNNALLATIFQSTVKNFLPVENSNATLKKERKDMRSDIEAVLAYTRDQTKPRPQSFGQFQSGGLNIVGFARGELGIGEDVRMAARACATNTLPFVIYEPTYAIASRQGDLSANEYLVNEPHYAVNLTFLPGVEAQRLYFQDGGKLFNKRYNIGAWQWELPHWPDSLRRALPLAQELWCASTFIMETMQRATRVPVLHMPMGVALPELTPIKRRAHGLPDDIFLYLFVFDGLSWGERKNPLGVIRAFQDAFPKQQDVRLVVKVMNATQDMFFWRCILEKAAKDTRILCINEIYSRAQILNLFACCDAYISLHRAEGFGRTIAEAMLLEKPVIATAWSGNADFTNEETAFPVTGKLIPLNKNDYIFWEDQYWCEPDHDMAVAALRECFYNPALAKIKAKAGQTVIRKNYSPETVGQLYIKRLRELGCL